MKLVSFEVAKALKDAGYPQEEKLSFYSSAEYKDFTIGQLYDATIDWTPIEYRVNAPTYLEVWLWLWREKGTPIQVDYAFWGVNARINDPEDAIISAIDYLVEHNLIK